jgi:hypothetical protein
MLRWEHREFEASLGFTVRPCPSPKQNGTNKQKAVISIIIKQIIKKKKRME